MTVTATIEFDDVQMYGYGHIVRKHQDTINRVRATVQRLNGTIDVTLCATASVATMQIYFDTLHDLEVASTIIALEHPCVTFTPSQ